MSLGTKLIVDALVALLKALLVKVISSELATVLLEVAAWLLKRSAAVLRKDDERAAERWLGELESRARLHCAKQYLSQEWSGP